MKHRFITSFFLLAMFLLVGQGCIGSSTGADGVKTTGPAGMYITTDKGEHWQPIVSYPTAEGVQNLSGASVYKIVPDLHDLQTLYWLSREHGMFFTTDDGKTWQRVKGSLESGFVYDLAIHPRDPCTIYATNGTFIFKSEDCTRSWVEVYRESRTDVGIRSVEFHQFPPYQIFTGSTNGDVLVSNDFGESWSVSERTGMSISDIVADPFQKDRLYISTKTNGLYRTDDGGTVWTSLSAHLSAFPQALEYRRLVLHPTKPGVLYWISTYGILVSEDAGDTWTAMSLITPPGSAQIYTFGVNPQNDNDMYYTATINNRSTFYRSIDGGQSWITRRLPTGQIPTALFPHPEHPDWVYLGFTIRPKT